MLQQFKFDQLRSSHWHRARFRNRLNNVAEDYRLGYKERGAVRLALEIIEEKLLVGKLK